MPRRHRGQWRKPYVSLRPAPIGNDFGAVFQVFACYNIYGLEVDDPVDDEDLYAMMIDPHIDVVIRELDFK